MIPLLIDMIIIWTLMNYFSDYNWDNERGKVFGITLCIVVFGGLATNMLHEQLGYLTLGIYVLVGGVIFRIAAYMSWKNAFKAMGIFLGIKIAMLLFLIFILSSF